MKFRIDDRVNLKGWGDGIVVARDAGSFGGGKYTVLYAVRLDNQAQINGLKSIGGPFTREGLKLVHEDDVYPSSPLFVDPGMA